MLMDQMYKFMIDTLTECDAVHWDDSHSNEAAYKNCVKNDTLSKNANKFIKEISNIGSGCN